MRPKKEPWWMIWMWRLQGVFYVANLLWVGVAYINGAYHDIFMTPIG